MPAISIGYETGKAVVLVDSCLVVTPDGVYGEPFCGSIDGSPNDERIKLTPTEFSAFNFRRIIPARLFKPSIVRIRTSIYGKRISDRLPAVVSVQLHFLEQFSPNNTFVRMAVPRMAWLATYNRLRERRLALAMADHNRLGLASFLRCVLSSNDIMSILLGEM